MLYRLGLSLMGLAFLLTISEDSARDDLRCTVVVGRFLLGLRRRAAENRTPTPPLFAEAAKCPYLRTGGINVTFIFELGFRYRVSTFLTVKGLGVLFEWNAAKSCDCVVE